MCRWLFICLFGALVFFAADAPVSAQSASGASNVERSVPKSRPRIVIHSRRTDLSPNARRHCRAWLAQEYRVSGTVIVPRMQCWWQ
jgi:hypothetical protein